MSPENTNNSIATNDQRGRLVDRVRALLAKAERTDHEPERHAFLAKAQQLITRHHIEQIELMETSADIGQEQISIDDWGNATRGVINLWGRVAELNRCSTAANPKRGEARVYLFGTDIDRELTRTLVEHLLPQLQRDILRDRPRSRMSYSLGWSIEVGQRLSEARTAEAAIGGAMVPTNVAASEALEEAYDLRRGRSSRVEFAEFGSGRLAGQQVDIGATKLDR